MTQAPTEPDATEAFRVFLTKVTYILDQHQVPLSMLRLSAYATDAMRVLRQFEHHANMSQPVDDMLKSICGDWRNPGSIDDPGDLIAVALIHVSLNLRHLYADLERILAEADASTQP